MDGLSLFLRPRFLVVISLGAACAGFASAQPLLREEPLKPRSTRTGSTLFTSLPSERTGIVTMNHYADPEMWAERYQELAYGAMGTGVAIGDYDNDGRPDVFVVSKTGSSRLFRNLGDWRFEDVTEPAGVVLAPAGLSDTIMGWFGAAREPVTNRANWSQGAAFADVNNDGWLDLYVCQFNSPNLLYVNQGDGTFQEEAESRGLGLVDSSVMAAFCDYDRDGWLDVYVQTSLLNAAEHPRGRRDRLYRNQGDGTFVEVTDRAGISGETMGHSATWWDHDEDGWPDLYVANDYDAPDQLYRNNRDGTFTDVLGQVVPQMPYYGMGSDLGDVDNDGRFDFSVADMAPTTHEKDLRGMAFSRARTQQNPEVSDRAPQLMRNALYLNTGTGRMLEAATLAGVEATDWTWSLRFEDLNNDGWTDLHVTNGMSREYHNTDLLDRIMAVEDLGGSRRAMKAMPPLNERNLVYRNVGAGLAFEEVGAEWGMDQEGVSFGAGFGDLDGDGDLDVVIANYEAGATVLRNDSESGGRVLVVLRGKASNRYGVGAVVRVETELGQQARQLVVARGYLSSSEPVLHFGLGEAASIRQLVIEWPSGQRQEFRDLAVNRRYTIEEPAGAVVPREERREGETTQFVEEGERWGLALESVESFEAEQQPLLPMRFDRRGPALAVGDLDGDGWEDVVLGGTSRQPAEIHLGGERFRLAARLPVSPLDDGPVLLVEVNGDGRLDILQTRAGTSRPAGSPDYQPVVHLNRGGGRFEPAADVLPAVPLSVGAAVAADFDRDGWLDVFLGGRVLPRDYPAAPPSVLLRNIGGRYEAVTAEVAPELQEVGMVSSALWSDVNVDGWPDLLVALEWGEVRVFENQSGRQLKDVTAQLGFSTAGSGWWTSLATADFNGDGRPDYVAGNVGLNTPYRAPAIIYTGRFAAGNASQLVEAVEVGGELRPLRSRNDLVKRIPLIRRRYDRNDDYARATLEEILGADRLAEARRYEATELRSGVFLSQADGRYRFEPLPRIAQIAPLQGIVAGDFDGDGHADIYAVQNMFAPVPFVGPFAGGLSQLLVGDGRGGFAAVPAAASGLVVPGDAKALVTADVDRDGWPDFLVSRNGAETRLFRNRAVPDRSSLQLVLAGPPRNPAAAGARLRVELRDGSFRSLEMAAGSGYYSQSGPHRFVGYSAGNPPVRVLVDWPDGTVTHSDVGDSPQRLLIRAPEQ